MKTLKLTAVPPNEKQPESILCTDNKNEIVVTIWADGAITVNPSTDLMPKELKQVNAIQQNFELFYNNIKN